MFWLVRQILGRWNTDQRVQEPRILGGSVSKKPTDETVLESMERRRLGDKRRASEDRLVKSSIHSGVQKLQRERLCVVGGSVVVFVRNECGGERMAVGKSWHYSTTKDEVGSEELHDIQLLYRRQEIPSRLPSGVFTCLLDLVMPPHCTFAFLSFPFLALPCRTKFGWIHHILIN